MDEVARAKKYGWPLTAAEIIQERVEFEDRLLHKHVEVVHDPVVMRKELPAQTWTPTARYVFGNGVIRAAMSLLP